MLGARNTVANSHFFDVFNLLASLTYCQDGTSLLMTVLCIEIWKDRGNPQPCVEQAILRARLAIGKLDFALFLWPH